MQDNHQQDLSPPGHEARAPDRKRLRFWLLGGVVALLLILSAGFLLSGFYLSSPAVLKKIQQVVAEQAGIKMEFQAIELDYLPRPAVILQQVNLAIPDYGQGTVAEIGLSPAFLPLLVGELRLGRLSLEQPEFSLSLPGRKTQESPASSSEEDVLQAGLASGLAMLGKVSADFKLVINAGRLHVGDQESLIETDSLDLQLAVSAAAANTASATLRSKAAVINLRRNGHAETLKDAELNGSLALDGETISLAIERLALDEPGLEVSGKIEQARGRPAVSMEISGRNIDVDATRRVALALAGDVDLAGEIFNYLRGGTVTEITVVTRGRTAAEMGTLKNIRIEGRLRDGSVSVPQIELDLTETSGDVLVADGVLHGTGMSARLEGSSGHDGSLQVGLAEGQDLFRLELMLNADLAQAGQILRRIVANEDFIAELNRISGLQGTGTGRLVLGDSLGNLHAKVDVSDLNFSAAYERLPFPIKVTGGQVAFAESLVSVKDMQGTIGDSAFSKLACQVDLAGHEAGASPRPGRVELGLDGTLQEDLVNWLSTAIAAPQDYAIRSPLHLSSVTLSWVEGTETTFKGGLSVQGGPELVLDLAWQPDRLNIHDLKLKDQYSDVDLSLAYGTGGVALRFAGALQHESLEAMFVAQDFGRGRLEGDFSMTGDVPKKSAFAASGHLNGSNLSFTLPSGDALEIERVKLSAHGDQVDVDLAQLSWRDLTWGPVKARLDFGPDKPVVRVDEANLCGIKAPGRWEIDGENLDMDVTLEGKALDVTTVAACVARQQQAMTGTLDLSGQVSGRGRPDELVTVLHGPLEMTFTNGLIRQGKTLARILEVLNVTEIVKGRLPSLGSEAFAYRTIVVQGEFGQGKLLIKKIQMDGETLDVLGQGEIDLVGKTVAVELLAAPFKTVDTVVKNIPGVNYLMAGSLVAIPISVRGPLDDPQVKVLSAASVGSSLLRLGERTIKSPLRLIEKFTPLGGGQSQ